MPRLCVPLRLTAGWLVRVYVFVEFCYSNFPDVKIEERYLLYFPRRFHGPNGNTAQQHHDGTVQREEDEVGRVVPLPLRLVLKLRRLRRRRARVTLNPLEHNVVVVFVIVCRYAAHAAGLQVLIPARAYVHTKVDQLRRCDRRFERSESEKAKQRAQVGIDHARLHAGRYLCSSCSYIDPIKKYKLNFSHHEIQVLQHSSSGAANK
ncbi:unnamed protein product [Trichogramma brassicae]|uniref:Secreted protein n=1 Tax=Trichogramma brassicae TaxID=86971 RepID=A0A6H5I7G2_9HYME|nr:unnamed protein product [Trichogramma brassicae]